MTDKELLELAAKAVGIKIDYRRGSDAHYFDDPETGREQWDPLNKDGQAFRLAVRLRMLIDVNGSVVHATNGDEHAEELCRDDGFAAARRAIVRAAAEIGKQM